MKKETLSGGRDSLHFERSGAGLESITSKGLGFRVFRGLGYRGLGV